jgi:hypothetical protein
VTTSALAEHSFWHWIRFIAVGYSVTSSGGSVGTRALRERGQMLIAGSTVSPFVRGLPDSPGVSVVCGARSTFEGPQDRSPGQLLPGVKVGLSTRSARTCR